MKRYIALLRAINVGANNRVPMADLRQAIADLGHANARTMLNSGNAIFDASRGTSTVIAKSLRAAVAARTGVDTEIVVKTVAEIEETLQSHPLRAVATDDARLLVMFTQDPTRLHCLRELMPTKFAPESLAFTPHAAWLWCPDGIHQSKLALTVHKSLGTYGTARNRMTMEKLVAMATTAVP